MPARKAPTHTRSFPSAKTNTSSPISAETGFGAYDGAPARGGTSLATCRAKEIADRGTGSCILMVSSILPTISVQSFFFSNPHHPFLKKKRQAPLRSQRAVLHALDLLPLGHRHYSAPFNPLNPPSLPRLHSLLFPWRSVRLHSLRARPPPLPLLRRVPPPRLEPRRPSLPLPPRRFPRPLPPPPQHPHTLGTYFLTRCRKAPSRRRARREGRGSACPESQRGRRDSVQGRRRGDFVCGGGGGVGEG